MDAIRWAVVGDVVGSRGHPDRGALQSTLEQAFLDVAERLPTPWPPTTTIGDEFQAAYPSRDAALDATLWLHVVLVGVARVRLGIGRGEVLVDADRFPFGEDGPAWWQAREALELVQRSERRGAGPRRWTAIVGDDPLVDRYLAVRDLALQRLDRVDAVVLRGLADGVTQRDLAERLDLNPSSVSRRIVERGLRTLLPDGVMA